MTQAIKDFVEELNIEAADVSFLGSTSRLLAQAADLIENLTTWRDIESAPRDGRYLGVIKNEFGIFGEPFVCEYDEDAGHICQFQTEHLPHKPTHWMPLPLTENKDE